MSLRGFLLLFSTVFCSTTVKLSVVVITMHEHDHARDTFGELMLSERNANVFPAFMSALTRRQFKWDISRCQPPLSFIAFVSMSLALSGEGESGRRKK